MVAWGIGAAGCSYQPLPPLAGNDASVNPPRMFMSCQGLADTCGPNGNEDCCDSLPVIGGAYYRSYDPAGDADSGNQSFPAMVSSFRLDKYEVTVARFRAFVIAGKGTQQDPPGSGDGAHAKIQSSGWDPSWNTSLAVDQPALVADVSCDATLETWTDNPGPNETRPMNCITWYEAMAFCAWDGGFLPTEAEWNYAAAGGGDSQGQRSYPWSNPPGSLMYDGMHASYYDGGCIGDGMPACAVTDLVRVGTKPAGNGRWGQADLAGNVREWVLDWYGGYVNPCSDCALISSALSRVQRGGSFDNYPNILRAGFRGAHDPKIRDGFSGVRCARSP